MDPIDDPLIVLREEIDEIFLKQFENKSFKKVGEEIKGILFEAGKLLYKRFEQENGSNFILGQYVYYLENHFLNLVESYFKNKKEKSDIFQRLNQMKYDDPIYFFFRYGFFCMILMTKEMQRIIFIEKIYSLFWYELYNFWNRLNLEYKNSEDDRIQKMLSELDEKKLVFSPNLYHLLKRKKIRQFEGRPTKINQIILLKFADLLEENRKEKKHTLKELLEMASENNMEPTTIRNWLRSYMPLLEKPKKSILELTKADMLFMWNEYQKGKNGIDR